MNIFSPAIKQLAHFRLFCNHFDTKTKKHRNQKIIYKPPTPSPPTTISYQKYFVFHTVYPQHPPKRKKIIPLQPRSRRTKWIPHSYLGVAINGELIID